MHGFIWKEGICEDKVKEKWMEGWELRRDDEGWRWMSSHLTSMWDDYLGGVQYVPVSACEVVSWRRVRNISILNYNLQVLVGTLRRVLFFVDFLGHDREESHEQDHH